MNGIPGFHLVRRRPVWTLGAASLILYLLFPLWFPLLPFYDRQPLPDVRTFSPSLPAGGGYALLLLALFALYWLAARWFSGKKTHHLFFLTALFCLPLLFTFPINATDVYRYFIRARVTVVHGASSLEVAPNAFPNDPYLPLAGEWAGETSPYGPVWELVAAGVTWLSRDNLLAALLLFKGLGAVLHLGSGAVIWNLLQDRDPAGRTHLTLLWLWNPALLLTFVMDAHNDILMLFWLLLGLWVMRRYNSRPGIGLLVMALAPLTKPIGLLALPVFFLARWRQINPIQARLRFLLIGGLGSLTLAWLAFLPFGSPIELAQRLLREASSGGGFSPLVLLLLILRRLGSDLPVSAIVNVGTALFVLLALWLLWRTWRGRSPLRSAADIFAAYLGTAITFRIWYTVWPFPWLLLDQNQQRRRAGLWFLLTGQLSVLIYGHLRVFLLRGDYLIAHLIGVPLTFGLPLLLAAVFANKPRSDRRQTEK